MSITWYFMIENDHLSVQIIFIYASYLLYIIYYIIIIWVEQLYADTYLYIGQYIYILYSFVHNIITNISKCHIFDIFCHFSFPPYLS
jgi:hypothetical protein